MAQVPKHRQLPDKEAKLFKELLVRLLRSRELVHFVMKALRWCILR